MNCVMDAIIRFFIINVNTLAHIYNNQEWITSPIDKEIITLFIVKRLARLTITNVENELE